MTTLRALRRVCFAGATVSGLLGVLLAVVPARADVVTATPSGQTPADLFGNFAGVADAAAVFQTADRTTGVAPAVYEPIYGRLADGLSHFGSQSLDARASVYYPGAAVVGAGTLLCTAAGSGTPFCNLPPYPLYAQADQSNPTAAVASPGAGGTAAPAGIGAANADAKVDPNAGVSTNAVVANYDVPEGSGAVVHVASIEAHTKQFIDPKGKLTVEADTRLSGVKLLGGLVQIASIEATSTSTDDGNGHQSKTEDFNVGGVTASGQPATIGANGITINGSGQGKPVIDLLNSTLQSALSNAGMKIRTIGKSPTSLLDPSGCTGGDVEGLQVQSNVKLDIPPNLPAQIEQVIGQFADTYFANIVLGGACTDAAAYAAVATPDTTPGASGSPPPAAPGGTGTSGTLSAGSDQGLSSGNPVPSGSLASPAAPRSVSLRPRPVRYGFLEAELRTHRVAHALELLYLAFTLLFMALCLGLRPLLPARLPSGRS